MPFHNDVQTEWGSRRKYLMMLFCQIIGIPIFSGIANNAVIIGATGYILVFFTASIIIGIPLLYMEFIIGQFTARDCIDVWKIYSCVSHIGYIQLFWQLITIVGNHVINSFVLHYLLISFEIPVPYYTCGHWSKKNCGIISYNYTVNEECIKNRKLYWPKYCSELHTTFQECHYWRYKMLGEDNAQFHIAWRVCLASGLICLIMYLNCFKRKKSVKWLVEFYIMYPVIAYVLLLMGSMVQKGVVEIYEDALDSDFAEFSVNFRFYTLLLQVVSSLGIGSGVTFNLACSSAFRSPCYSNTVITVVVSAAMATLVICTTAMMSCPYAFTYKIDPYLILEGPMSLLFEKTPRFISEYQHKYFWLVLIFSCQAALGIGTNLIYMLHVLDMIALRSERVAKYPGLTTFAGVIVLYLGTIPLLGDFGMDAMVRLRQLSCLVSVFIAIIETLVFVLWYGLGKFSEDVHFMQGLPPNKYTRLGWMLSSVLLTYTFVYEVRKQIELESMLRFYSIGWYLFLISIAVIGGMFLLKLIIAATRKQFLEVFKLNSKWGPKNELLQRSRAMFTAQAMTKEYLYRQYHLQAGIVARQKLSNCRETVTIF